MSTITKHRCIIATGNRSEAGVFYLHDKPVYRYIDGEVLLQVGTDFFNFCPECGKDVRKRGREILEKIKALPELENEMEV